MQSEESAQSDAVWPVALCNLATDWLESFVGAWGEEDAVSNRHEHT